MSFMYSRGCIGPMAFCVLAAVSAEGGYQVQRNVLSGSGDEAWERWG